MWQQYVFHGSWLCHDLDSQLLVSHNRGLGLIPGQSAKNLSWTEWHWDRLSSKYFSFPQSVSFHQCFILLFHVSTTDVTQSWQLVTWLLLAFLFCSLYINFPSTLPYSFILFGIFGIQSGTGTDIPWDSSVIVPSMLDTHPPSGLPYWVHLRSEYWGTESQSTIKRIKLYRQMLYLLFCSLPNTKYTVCFMAKPLQYTVGQCRLVRYIADYTHIAYRCNFYIFFTKDEYFWCGMFPKAKNVACVQKFDTFFAPQFPINIQLGVNWWWKIIVV